MILIDEIVSMGSTVRFYNGIDFDMIDDHPKDGSDGFLYFFVDKWVDEISIYKRESKINSIIGDGSKIVDIESINNNWIAIYQTDGNTKAIYDIIKTKFDDGALPYGEFSPVAGDRYISTPIPTNRITSGFRKSNI